MRGIPVNFVVAVAVVMIVILTQFPISTATSSTVLTSNEPCTVCQCQSIGPDQSHYKQLNCTHRQLSTVLADYPALPSDSGAFLNIIFDDNPVHQLSALPATHQTIAFSCRRCALSELAASAFAAVHRIERLDLSENPRLGAGLWTTPETVDAIWTSATIVELVLSDTGLERLPVGAFASVAGLRRLDLSANRLRMPMATLLAALPVDLLHLDVSGNLLADDVDGEPAEESQLLLLELNAWNNGFTAPPSSLLRLAGTLQHLDLGGDQLLRISNVTGALHELRTLRIHTAPRLELVSADALIGLPQLRRLEITGNRALRSLNVTGLLAVGPAHLEVLDLRGNGMRTVLLPESGNETDADRSSSALRELLLADNPWHCDCDLYRALGRLVAGSSVATMLNQSTSEIASSSPIRRFESDFNARCSTPHSLATDFLADLLAVPEERTPACAALRNAHKPPVEERWPAGAHERRPRQILLTIACVLAVVLFGTLIGLAIVYGQRRLRGDGAKLFSRGGSAGGAAGSGAGGAIEMRASTVRYTTVRNSTIPVPLDVLTVMEQEQQQQMRLSLREAEPRLEQRQQLDERQQHMEEEVWRRKPLA